ncbi:hypothetical protein C2E23DRAFT_626666 [Lenzites betulinus]|nr:hypothetical protein C2E23DRAFT_626666 [Lenzites betulinus]
MDVDPPSPLQQQQPYAILRIKRKRNEEPLDALVVDSAPRRKRSRGGLNIFQYAGTVEQAAWNDEQQKKALEKRIAGLARESVQKKPEEAAGAPAPTAVPVPKSTPGPAAAPASPVKSKPTHAHPAMRPHHATPRKTYTIVPQEEAVDPRAPKQNATAPPKVFSSKEVEEMKRRTAFKTYDAVPSSSSGNIAAVSDTDKEIEKFLPLLKDYLNVSDLAPPSAPAEGNDDSMDEDYVYDVFYHRPTTFQELYEPGTGSNIAKLTGLPPELSGLSGEDESDEEYDDEDDEDSNAEDWYTNDYPEEEDPESEDDLSDEFHENSDAEDVMHDGERDMGAYRNVMTL